MRHLDPNMGWRPPQEPEGQRSTPFRTCSFCGSIHPEDLVKALPEVADTRELTQLGSTIRMRNVEVADWKYGWPHKIYIHGIPNPNAERIVRMGTHDGNPYMRAEGPAWAKFYTIHFTDDGFDEEALALLSQVVRERTGIRFYTEQDDEGRTLLRYRVG